MPASKVYVVDELESLKGHCKQRKQKSLSASVQLNSNESSSMVVKKEAPKYVLRMMSSINFNNIFGVNASEDNFDNIKEDDTEGISNTINTASAPPPSVISAAVSNAAKELVSDVESVDHIEHIAEKLTCKKVDFDKLMRDTNASKRVIDRKFSVHEHIKLKSESSAFKFLSHYFGSGSCLRVPIGNEFPQTLKLADGRKVNKAKNKRASNAKHHGMVIFVNPDFLCEHSCTLSITGDLPRPPSERHLRPERITFDTTFWANGDTNGLELTNRRNLSGRMSQFGGVVPAKEGRHRRSSMPGWNGRVPMWVPFSEGQCTVTRTSSPSHLSGESCNKEEDEPETDGATQVSHTLHKSTYNFQNTFGELRHNVTAPPLSFSCAEVSPYDTKCFESSFGLNSSGCKNRGGGGVVFLTVFPCESTEVAVEKLTILSRKYENQSTGGTTLHGNMPALNLACLHGNAIAARKLLKAGADPNRVAGSTGSTPLHDAVVGGHHDIVKLLLDHHANQTVCDESGMTPLHVCCVNNDVTGARVLLQHKDARKALAVKDKHNRTPRMSCSRSHLRDVIKRECNRHGIKEKKPSSWWSNLAGAAGDRPSGLKKTTADDFMKMAVLVAKRGRPALDIHSATKKIVL